MKPPSASETTSASPARTFSLNKTVLWLCVLMVFFGYLRLRMLDLPLERDEGEYAYSGQLLLEGIPPYKQAYNMKLPGTYAVYAGFMALFGETARGIHLGLLLTVLATMVMVFVLARRLFGPVPSLFAAAAYGLFSGSMSVHGLAAHANHFVVAFALGGVLALLRAADHRSVWTAFYSGLLFGLAFLMKQHGLIFGLFGAGWLAWETLRQRPLNPWRIARQLAAYFTGLGLPFAIICLLLWRAGVFEKFWFWTFTYAQAYAMGTPFGMQDFLKLSWAAIAETAPLWGLATAGLSLMFVENKTRRCSAFVAGFLVFSAAGIFPGFYFRPNYYILLLPALSLLVAAAIHAGQELLANRRPMRHAAHVVAGLAMGLVFVFQWPLFFRLSPEDVSRFAYGENPFPESVVIGQYIRERSSPDAKIAVIGSEPQIYFYARRHSATGYIYTYALMEKHPYASQMQREMIAEIETARPEYIVMVGIQFSWVVQPESDLQIFEWFESYFPQHYKQVGVLDYHSVERQEFRWDEDAEGYAPQAAQYIYIFRRLPEPIEPAKEK